MLQSDECNRRLVTNQIADNSSTISRSDGHNHDTFVTSTLNSSSDHPLPGPSRPLSSARRYNTPYVPCAIVSSSRGEPQPGLTPPPSLDGSSTDVVLRGGGDMTMTIHTVCPNDSFASVALRYGVSIAALRRANQLWPSDPVHFRTKLLIPRGNTLRASHRPIRGPDATLRSTVESVPDFAPGLVTSSFTAARNIILSVLPARISLESLRSKASASEDHELDDIQTIRSHTVSTIGASSSDDGHELSVIPVPHGQHRLSSTVALSSQFPCSPADNQLMDLNHISPGVGYLHSRSVSSPSSRSLERPSHRQPFVLPVRTSQLEPEPAMELPVRRSRV